MPCTIEIADDGTPTLWIPEPSGEKHAYSVAPADEGDALWACTVARLDTGESYRVERRSAVTWWCSCPSYRHRRRGPEGKFCKHTATLQGARAFFRMLFGPAVRAALKGARKSCRM
jgi:hypothetical protein